MKQILTDKAPTPNGHYAQGIISNGWVYTSGQLGIDNSTGKIPDGFGDEAEQCLLNVISIIEASGASKAMIIRVGIYLTDISDWDRMNEIYTRVMGNHKPTRFVVGIAALHLGARVKVEAIASIQQSS